MKKIICLILTGLVVFALTGCNASWERSKKTWESDYGGGLDRTVTVYDYNGKEIKHWSGKFDVSSSEDKVYLDMGNKRVIIHGGIVINEEN